MLRMQLRYKNSDAALFSKIVFETVNCALKSWKASLV